MISPFEPFDEGEFFAEDANYTLQHLFLQPWVRVGKGTANSGPINLGSVLDKVQCAAGKNFRSLIAGMLSIRLNNHYYRIISVIQHLWKTEILDCFS